MKNVICELHKVALAALVLGVFSASPYAKAEPPVLTGVTEEVASLPDADRVGLKWNEFKNMTDNLQVTVTKDNQLVFSGGVPAGCLVGMKVASIDDSNEGQHSVMIDMPKCPGGDTSQLTTAAQKKMKPLSLAIKPMSFDGNHDGKFCLLNYTDPAAKSCDAIPGKETTAKADAAALQVADAKAKQAEEDAQAKQKQAEEDAQTKADREAAQKAYDKKQQLINQLGVACRSGDQAGFGAAMQALQGALGDLSQYTHAVDASVQKKYLDQISKAKTAEDARSVYEEYLDKAHAAGWETVDTSDKYMQKRQAIVEGMIDGINPENKKDGKAVADALKELKADFDEVNDDLDTKSLKKLLTTEYQNLAAKYEEADMGQAEEYYNEAIKNADSDDKLALQKHLANVYDNALADCLKELQDSPTASLKKKCDALAKKDDQYMKMALKGQKRLKGDDAKEVFNRMTAQHISRFGNVGYGVTAVQVQEAQAIQQGQQNQYMKQMMGMGQQSQGGGDTGGGDGAFGQ